MRRLVALLTFVAGPLLAEPLPRADAIFAEPAMEAVRLGQLLFYDPILSGNRTISCASCHHPRFGTSDGVSLGLGDGAVGIGPDMRLDPQNPPEQRIPRNAPALFNLGAAEFTRFFHDGRLESDPTRPSGIRTPLGPDMEQGFASALAAQAMFPVLSGDEMAGHYSENDVAQAVRQGRLTGPGGAWAILAARIEAIPDYRRSFDAVIGPRPVTFADIANVIADFMVFEWRADDSPFDRFLRGEGDLPEVAKAGMDLFYGKARCATCHAGQFQTDHAFHAIAMPQIGPGKAARFERHNRDIGRMRVTGDPADAYAFRTPSLRNVTATAPYGHSGAYASLRAVVEHHLDPVASLEAYDIASALLPGPGFASDRAVLDDPAEMAAIAASNRLEPIRLTEAEVDALLAFLDTLTDPVALSGRLGIPDSVPSGLAVAR
ncbi:cytochrome-c peroxidase [Ruegeria pomeroyi]|uniref:Methylamine utilization protein MauG, putative n=2 Tax=Ruegeria pomeroyi TaxID=89184 RepID=Q5LV44_RUEPO|nr:cytochrome c peroxidase [Ruegeria pomeroyi]HCE71423.1 cytochrome-c peroxidase [Ruegeria sp.]AAV94163.1 methylamine utilization protein MauG, putative [Ruegeria pomeroyi DSS-3]NVK95764.1 cytochrome-c peroxidase [Ruegeria pomeroyi]NVL01165.1 cytochrome-c peroxidase [Ruegeria pomeroyi]QWV07739.1 cytochrome-c peroxidase [Ruegeria pomeroyi]